MACKIKGDARSVECRSIRFGPKLVLFSVLTPPSEGATQLTAAETEVAGLAAAGFSNRIIAKRRRRSIRTVGHQLASIYAKLGVSGRRELRVALIRHLEP
jgi:DNA-binding CsgD family transcriptional regulator